LLIIDLKCGNGCIESPYRYSVNEITLIDILGPEADDVIKEVDLKIKKSKIYSNLDILDDREKEVVVSRFGLDTGGEERT
jgi:RNA polymerase sporulation-specific sigma factor